MQNLDLGLSQSIGREVAIHKSNLNSSYIKTLIVNSLYLFFIIGLILSAAGYLNSKFIVDYWLNIDKFIEINALISIEVFFATFFFKWMSGTPRAILYGKGDFLALGLIVIFANTIRYFGLFFIFNVSGYNIVYYFYLQLFSAILEMFFLFKFSIFSKYGVNINIEKINLKIFNKIYPIAKNIGISTLIWTILTQLDKLILSSVLNLSDYGIFSIAVLGSTAISYILTPIISLVLPRFTELYSKYGSVERINLYTDFTKCIVFISSLLSFFVIFNARNIIFLWTGDMKLADEAYLILIIYTIGYLFQSISGVSYFIQYASGNMNYHVRGSLYTVIIYLPLVYILSIKYGALGAGISWILINLIYLLIWVPYINSKIIPGNNINFFKNDIIRISLNIFIIFIPFYFLEYFVDNEYLHILFYLLASSILIFGISLYVLKDVRAIILNNLLKND